MSTPAVLTLPLLQLTLVDARVQKRPLFHPAIPSPHAGPSQPKIIYISATTPFMSAVKRVRRMLDAIDKRHMGHGSSGGSRNRGGTNKNVDRAATGAGRDATQPASTTTSSTAKEREEVLLKATNRAIEKALKLAMFFQKAKEGYRVTVRTGTIRVVDDIVEDDRPRKRRKRGGTTRRDEKEAAGDEDGLVQGVGEEQDEEVDAPEGILHVERSAESPRPIPVVPEPTNTSVSQAAEGAIEDGSMDMDPPDDAARDVSMEMEPSDGDATTIDSINEDAPDEDTTNTQTDENKTETAPTNPQNSNDSTRQLNIASSPYIRNARVEGASTARHSSDEPGSPTRATCNATTTNNDSKSSNSRSKTRDTEPNEPPPSLPETQIRRMSFVQVGIRRAVA